MVVWRTCQVVWVFPPLTERLEENQPWALPGDNGMSDVAWNVEKKIILILNAWDLELTYRHDVMWKSLSCVWLFATTWTVAHQASLSIEPGIHYSPWDSPGQNTGVGSLSLLQGIFPTQGSNPNLPHLRQILYQLTHKGSPRVLAWVAYPFSSGSSQPRNRTKVSPIAGRFFTNWATTEAQRTCDISESESLSVVSDSLQPQALYSPWNSPGQNIGVDSCSLLQGIFPTQGWNPGLPHCRQIL